MVKGTCYSSRGPKFTSQNLYEAAYNCLYLLISGLGIQCSLLTPEVTVPALTCTNLHSHTYTKKCHKANDLHSIERCIVPVLRLLGEKEGEFWGCFLWRLYESMLMWVLSSKVISFVNYFSIYMKITPTSSSWLLLDMPPS